MAFDMISSVPTSAQGALGGALPSAPPKEPLDDSAQRIKAFDAKQDALGSKLDTIRADTVDKNVKLEDFFAKNKPPEYKPPAPYVPPKEDNVMSVWGAVAMGFAALASRFTRTPMTTALNAGGSIMKALKEKDVAAAQSAYQQWKDANTQALDMAKYQQAAYANLMQTIERREKNNIELSKDEQADVRTQMTALASAFKDETMLKIGESRDIRAQKAEFDRREKEISQLQLAYEKMNKQAEAAQEKIAGAQAEAALAKNPEYIKKLQSGDTLGALEMQAEVNPSEKNTAKLAELQEKKKVDDEKEKAREETATSQAKQQYDAWKASPEGASASIDDQRKKEAEIYGSFKSGGNRLYPPITPENKSYLASQFASYQLKPPTDAQLGRQPDMLAALEEAKKINPDFNPAKYDSTQAARKKITSGKDSDAIASYVRLDQHLDFFKGLVEKLSDGSDIKTLNKLAKAWGVETGNPDVTSYETALQLVGDEMVKAATGTGAAGALGDREEIKKNFDPSLDKDQLRANINAVQVLVGGAMVSTLNKYKNILTPKELTDAVGSRDVMEHFHVNPDTLQPIVEGAYGLGDKSYDPKTDTTTAKPGAQGGFKAQWTDKNGKPFGVVGGKYVYEDGTPVQ